MRGEALAETVRACLPSLPVEPDLTFLSRLVTRVTAGVTIDTLPLYAPVVATFENIVEYLEGSGSLVTGEKAVRLAERVWRRLLAWSPVHPAQRSPEKLVAIGLYMGFDEAAVAVADIEPRFPHFPNVYGVCTRGGCRFGWGRGRGMREYIKFLRVLVKAPVAVLAARPASCRLAS